MTGVQTCALPISQFILKPLQEDGKNLLALEVSPGRSTPYYYKADGVMEAYIRVGNESVIAPDYIVNELILKGTNQSFDTLTTDAVKKDYSFTLLEATYLERTGLRFEPSDYVSFGLTDKNGLLTNAGRSTGYYQIDETDQEGRLIATFESSVFRKKDEVPFTL